MALNGSPNIKRLLVARFALTLADPKQLFQSDQLNKICRLFNSIEHLIQLNDIVRNLSSVSFMYWHHEAVLSIYLRHVIDGTEASDIEKIQVNFYSLKNIQCSWFKQFHFFFLFFAVFTGFRNRLS